MDPVRVRHPDGAEIPRIIYDSPHSGRFYPDDFATKAIGADLRRGEDAYVDELLADAPAAGVVVIDGVYPRCYIDVNRAETDIDAELLSEPWPGELSPTEKSARGLGLIRRFVTPGVEVNAGSLTVAEVRSRIERIYRPYYATLEGLVHQSLRAYGVVWHLNWHSMKAVGNNMTPDGPGAARPDFIVSDRDGQSTAPRFTEWVVTWLRQAGYRVAVNDPYKGGTIIQRIGAPGEGVNSVQIEISRALYLDEQRVEMTPGTQKLTGAIGAMTRDLVEWVGRDAAGGR